MKRLYLGSLYLVLFLTGIFAFSTVSSQVQSCEAGETTHIIQLGQNLFRIAQSYGVSMDTIAQRNNITDITRIIAGDSLCIPGGNGIVQPVIVPATNSTTSTTAYNNEEYNWCNDPAVWGDGRCDNPDPSIRECHYKMGWYLPRVASGEFSLGAVQTNCLGVIENVEIQVETDANTGCQFLVVVLNGSPFTGSANINVDGDDYDGSEQELGKCKGLAIHGNNNANTLSGGSGNDAIFGYAGNDTLNGNDGDDTLNGGNESCDGPQCNAIGTLGDILNGNNGNDLLNGGNETCTGAQCNTIGDRLGDILNGGDGDDTLNGGNETCDGAQCNTAGGSIGDTLNGENGNDTLNGGNESCTGAQCNTSASSNIGDTIDGGADTDSANGGTESAEGGSGTTGDTCSNNESQSNCP